MTWRKRLVRRLRPIRSLLSGKGPDGFRRVLAEGRRPVEQRYFYLGPELALLRLNAGPLIYVDPLDEQVSASLIADGYWEGWVTAAVLSVLRPGSRVIEVGANVGYYTMLMTAWLGTEGHVTTLEANPRMAGLVRRSIRINGFGERVRLVAKAAMDRPGTVEFVTSRTDSGGGHVAMWEGGLQDGHQRFEVPAVRLDDLDCGAVDLIRLDAEGSEPFILRGAEGLLRANPQVVVCMEWSVEQMGRRTSVPEFVAWLQGLGFSFWKIGLDSGLTPIMPAALLAVADCDVVLSRGAPAPVARAGRGGG